MLNFKQICISKKQVLVYLTGMMKNFQITHKIDDMTGGNICV